MQINLHKKFLKMYGKKNFLIREKFKERRNLFIETRNHPLLNDHALTGAWEGHRSINITGDIRAVYRLEPYEQYVFVAIGTHHELYGS